MSCHSHNNNTQSYVCHLTMSILPACNWHPKLQETQFREAVSISLQNHSMDEVTVRQQLFNLKDENCFHQ